MNMQNTNDDLKWFGEGFDGFPRSLPEDCVEYTICIIEVGLKDFEIREKLREVHTAANTFTRKLLKDFIWQREGFHLDLVQENGSSVLRGRTDYADSVEDEWLIVYILLELSKKFSRLWIRIVDTDGQFLLVEAANALPRWLNPEIADHRVWINDGRLLIIAPKPPTEVNGSIGSTSEPRAMTLDEAWRYLQSYQSELLHSPLIQAEAFCRLLKYPQQITESLHHALITIPRKLAFILHQEISYISPAVEAFYLRDPIAMRPLRASESIELIFPANDLVTVSVKFTKVGYAQMKSQYFAPPAVWNQILSAESEGKSQNRVEMGMKVTCGFEMLLSDPQNKDSRAVREINLLLEDIENGEEVLPSDIEMSGWRKEDDDESWLDINFEDFENELSGKRGKDAALLHQGFGDKGAQDNLRKIVARFENFLNDDTAGAEGADYSDDMDNDDEDDAGEADSASTSSHQSESEGLGEEINFKENEFATMMREMMGVSLDHTASTSPKPVLDETDTGHDGPEYEDEGGKIRKVMQDMEIELGDAGALQLDCSPNADLYTLQGKILASNTQSGLEHSTGATGNASGAENEEIDIDYNLAKNLLESFKSQGGAAGPGGNLLGLMGMHLPRDEDDTPAHS